MQVDGKLADLVEKDRGAVGQFETPGLLRHGTGIGTLFAAEQFSLDESCGQCRAIHFHQRAVSARAETVYRRCDQFLAGPGLPREQHRCAGCCHLLDLAQHVSHHFAVTVNPFARIVALDLLPEIDVFGFEALLQRMDLIVRP